VSLALALGALAVGCGLESRELAAGERTMFEHEVDGARVRLVVRYHGHYTGLREWMNTTGASSTGASRHVVDEVRTVRAGEPLEVVDIRDLRNGARPESDEQSRALVERLEVEHCLVDDAIVYRLRDPAGEYRVAEVNGGAGEWGLVRIAGASVVRGGFASAETDCRAAARAAPDTATMMAERDPAVLGRGQACLVFEQSGQRVEAIRCVVQSTNVPADLRERLTAAIASGDAEDDLYAALDPTFEWGEYRFHAAGLLEAAPDVERRAAHLAAWRAYCLSNECQSVVRGALRHMSARMDSAYCAELQATAEARLATEGVTAAREALSALIDSERCEGLDAARAPLLIRALARPSTPEPERPRVTGDRAIGECRTLAPRRPRVTSTSCDSLPRYAGAWLTRHCSPEAVAAARALTPAHPPTDWIHDPIADGAKRVIEACAN